MKPIYKHIIACVCALLVIAYMVFGVWMSHLMVAKPKCEHLAVQIDDYSQRQYVNSAELRTLIINKGLNPENKPASQVSLQKIEQTVANHKMVRSAECYRTIYGDVVVHVNQRVPLFHVLTEYETYQIDTDCEMMPPTTPLDVPFVVMGEVSHRMAQHEIYDFALWLKKDAYWNDKITGVVVHSPKMVELTDRSHGTKILLGEWQGFERKLRKLQHFFQADTMLHQNQYPQVDLRYKGQVVGIRN